MLLPNIFLKYGCTNMVVNYVVVAKHVVAKRVVVTEQLSRLMGPFGKCTYLATKVHDNPKLCMKLSANLFMKLFTTLTIKLFAKLFH